MTYYLDQDILKAGGVGYIKADQHQIGFLVWQGPQPVIVFLS